jgi:hypothetical protein
MMVSAIRRAIVGSLVLSVLFAGGFTHWKKISY